MRHRTSIFAVVALLSLVAAVPAHAAPPSSPPEGRPVAAADYPDASEPMVLPRYATSGYIVVQAKTLASVESVHVYLLTQLVVADRLGRDSVALRDFATRAGVTSAIALRMSGVEVSRMAILVRASERDTSNPAASPDSSAHPTFSGRRFSQSSIDSTGVRLPGVSRTR